MTLLHPAIATYPKGPRVRFWTDPSTHPGKETCFYCLRPVYVLPDPGEHVFAWTTSGTPSRPVDGGVGWTLSFPDQRTPPCPWDCLIYHNIITWDPYLEVYNAKAIVSDRRKLLRGLLFDYPFANLSWLFGDTPARARLAMTYYLPYWLRCPFVERAAFLEAVALVLFGPMTCVVWCGKSFALSAGANHDGWVGGDWHHGIMGRCKGVVVLSRVLCYALTLCTFFQVYCSCVASGLSLAF